MFLLNYIIYVWIYENGAKEFDFTLISLPF